MQELVHIAALALVFGSMAVAQSPPQCFYQATADNYASSYLGNDTTHFNTGIPRASMVNSTLIGFGINGFILDGPVFRVGAACTTTHVTFSVSQADAYQQHCICEGGYASGQGCTVISAGKGSPGVCPGPGGSPQMYDNIYDVGLYCIGGSCNFGHLYAATGPVDYSQLPLGVRTFSWSSGAPVTLQPGIYAIGMGTNCDQGSVAGQWGTVQVLAKGTTVQWVSGPLFVTDGSWNGQSIYIGGGPQTYAHSISSVSMDGKSLTLTATIAKTASAYYVVGASSGGGGGKCAMARGEGGSYGTGGTPGGGWRGTTQLLAFKDFVTILDANMYPADCLLFDPYHDNSIGLPGESPNFPSTLAAYDSGGCAYADNPNKSISPLAPFGQAPHMIDFAIW